MRGRLFGALLAATLFMALTATAHAGYAHTIISDGIGWATFTALPADRPDLRIQSLDGGTTVMIEDRASPITPGKPPTAGSASVPCEVVSTHVARCASPTIFAFQTDLSLNAAATIRDLPGDGRVMYWVQTGPAGDTIELSHGAHYDVRDIGGVNNSITLRSAESYVRLGPGTSTVDVANGMFDQVDCLRAEPSGLLDQPELGIGEHNLLDTVTADPTDRVVDCD